MTDSPRLTLLILIPALMGAASATPRLQPGLWQFTNLPIGASLDGRALGDLPYTAPTDPQQVCVSPAEAADPARWFTRDSGNDCSFTRATLTRGLVSIAGTCPPHDAGHARGNVRLTGRWTPNSYNLRFATETSGENGRMGFTGTMTGQRIGNCAR